MCRHVIMTTTSTSWTQRVTIFERLMREAGVEPFQIDGWGITEGFHLLKTDENFLKSFSYEWIYNFEDDRPLMGHVRSASVGTEIGNPLASHPYKFNNFIAAHNGSMIESYRSFGEVYTDSWRSLSILDSSIDECIDVKEKLLRLADSWLSVFIEGSTFVFTFHLGDIIAVIVGPQNKDIFQMQYEDGHILCTSKEALNRLKLWADAFKIYEHFGEIEQLPYSSISFFCCGEKTETYPLSCQLRPAPPPPKTSKRKRRG